MGPQLPPGALPPHPVSCHECDLVQQLPALHPGQHAACPRCGHTLCRISPHPFDETLAYAIASLLLLVLSCAFPLLGMQVQGMHSQISFLSSADSLAEADFVLVSNLLLLGVMIIPAAFLCAVLYPALGIRLRRHWPGMRSATALALRLKPWMMVDVFVLGVLVSMIKLAMLADVSLGPSFWPLLLFSLTLTLTVSAFDPHWQYYQLDLLTGHADYRRRIVTPHPCPHCGWFNRSGRSRCVHCGSTLHHRKPHSLQLTWGWLITALVLYVPANVYPIMITDAPGGRMASTIIGGIQLLWNMGSYPIAAIIFIASVMVPIAKFLALIVLCLRVRHPAHPRQLTQLYRITEFIGRWSMVDVFVVAVLVALVQMGALMSIYPGIAALSFAGMVLFTMLAAMSFDVRLLWDAHAHPQREPLHG